MFSDQITRTTILQVLAVGFALVILLLLAAGYFGVRNIESIRSSVASLEEEQAVTARLIDAIRGEQAALSAVFYKLSRDPETMDREAILADLDQTDQHIQRILSEAAGAADETLWGELEATSTAFAAEARRLLGQEDATTFLSRDLFHRHDQVISIVAQLNEANNRKALEVQNQIRLRSQELLQRSSILLGGCLVLALLCALLTVRITTDLFRKMEWQASELSRVSWHLVQNQESAARRFSHELHDELGQSLMALKANLVAMETTAPLDKQRLEDCSHLVDEAVRNVRELSHLLRPTILDDFGLDAGLRWLADRFTQRTGIDVEYESNFAARVSDPSETHLYRIAQEALTNVARHSKANHVWMRLRANGGQILLTIRDNGRGMVADREKQQDGLGLIGMQARARSVGGQMRMESANGSGVLIEVRIPLGKWEEVGATEKDPHLVGG